MFNLPLCFSTCIESGRERIWLGCVWFGDHSGELQHIVEGLEKGRLESGMRVWRVFV